MEINIEEIAMTLIGHAGEAKSLAFQALNDAKNGNFEEAEKLLQESGNELLKSHSLQTELIVKEAGGEKIDMGLIMVHSQDHLMNAILFKELVKEFIDVYKKMEEK